MSSLNNRIICYGQRNMDQAVFWEVIYRLTNHLCLRGSRAALQRFTDKIQIGDRVAKAIIERRIVCEEAALLLLSTATTRIAATRILEVTAPEKGIAGYYFFAAKEIADALAKKWLIKFVNKGIDIYRIQPPTTHAI